MFAFSVPTLRERPQARRASVRTAFEALVDAGQQVVFVVGFAHVEIHADFLGMQAVLVGGARGDHDDRDVPQALVAANVARQFEAVHARHFDVQQHDVGHHVDQLLERIDAVLGGQHMVAVAGQQPAADLAHRQRIVDHHHGRRGAGSRRGRRAWRTIPARLRRRRFRCRFRLRRHCVGARHERPARSG
jgi:hypothetical protein